MSSIRFSILAGVFGLVLSASHAGAEETMRHEIASRFAPAEMLRETLEDTLSDQGRFVILPNKGSVLVIDTPDRVLAAAEAVEALEIPPPNVQLSVGARTGGQLARPGVARSFGPVREEAGFPYPTSWDPPRAIQLPDGRVVTVPAHPRNFQVRRTGIILDTTASVNPDGSINVDVNMENTEFEGFINYGSPIFTTGVPTSFPLQGVPGNMAPLRQLLTENRILMPIFSTTRISTSVVVYPEVRGNQVRVQMLPRLSVSNSDSEEEEIVDLDEFRTEVTIENGQLATLPGFTNAPDEFNRAFLNDADQPKGDVELVFKAEIIPGSLEADDTE